ncbi:hypothetical protein L596_020301 [Steinernema carpocapsae]|uniref:Uncharacterized protein n=1 Tax=Steinernema carpocapsae TaxID=34508 RepID=A0A4U5MT46_STECR|nr:hypothetical protein L596_020301 [Steinernema carpocapsae]
MVPFPQPLMPTAIVQDSRVGTTEKVVKLYFRANLNFAELRSPKTVSSNCDDGIVISARNKRDLPHFKPKKTSLFLAFLSRRTFPAAHGFRRFWMHSTAEKYTSTPEKSALLQDPQALQKYRCEDGADSSTIRQFWPALDSKEKCFYISETDFRGNGDVERGLKMEGLGMTGIKGIQGLRGKIGNAGRDLKMGGLRVIWMNRRGWGVLVLERGHSVLEKDYAIDKREVEQNEAFTSFELSII